jgi:DNA-binding NarL/FixJ family response regulator
MSDSSSLTAIIAAPNVWTRRSIGTAVIEAGFEIAAEGANVVDVLRETEYLHPALVVLTLDAIGMNPLAIIGELREGEDQPEIVVVAHDTSTREHAQSVGAYDVVEQDDADALLRLLGEIREVLESGERRRSDERRSGADRRVRQEWSKVTTQRRDGTERRRGPRRKDDVADRPEPDVDALGD